MPELLIPSDREAALARFRSTPSGHEKPGRFWKIDIETLAPALPIGEPGGTLAHSAPAHAIVCDLQTARRDHAALLERAMGRAANGDRKFVALSLAYARLGAFVYVPADRSIDEPITISYSAAPGEAIFPYTIVLAERGARATIVERLDVGAGAFVCGIAEVVTEAHASIAYASAQFAPLDARIIFTRAALPGRDASVAWSNAELGAALTLADVGVTLEQPGARAKLATLFFPAGSQHVDVASAVDHRVGDTTSDTLVKTAATGAGQGRYLGTIRIAAHAQHSEATLRDDALLLSEGAHIDSVPALEIAANDVKAFHGATVGALDDEAIFYMSSRGIEPREAERMIALAFFEPAIEQFPSLLHEELREALVRKVESV
ncbi:MAG TPA: SufD family Fe-S cluster assembly protein [Candidatus Baltobacteraceae bacterium]|nr:SufD family Fe-S cluster assembly protein [Candidatus Baltobacteraceae bacterium]